MDMIVCDSNRKECELILTAIHDDGKKKGCEHSVRVCKDWIGLRCLIKEKETEVLIIALDGVESLDIVTGLKMPAGKIIWFSDLDFGVQAYRMSISYFQMKPITEEKLIHAFQQIGM